MGFAGVHARRGDGGDAATELRDNREGHFLGLVGDDAEFDCGMESVGDGVVHLAFDVLLARGHDEGQDAGRDVPVHFIDEEGGCDDDTVEDKDHPGDRGSGKLFLYHDRDDVHTARASAELKRKRDGRPDPDTARQGSEYFFFENQLRHIQMFHDGQPNRLHDDVEHGKDCKLFLHAKEGKNQQGGVDTEDRNALRYFSVGCLFHDDGDTRDAARRKIVGCDQAVGGKGHQKGGGGEK